MKKRSFDYIHTIRYMGNKGKLLGFVIPEIESITKKGETICDIMSGTSSIGYALKERNKIIANDCQFYSFVISKALLENYIIPTEMDVKNLLDEKYKENLTNNIFTFFVDNYSDTYFSIEQCKDIDALRYAISFVKDEQIFYFLLVLLMSAMCTAQSTTGHFAQFLPKNNKRTEFLRKLSIKELFYKKIGDFQKFKLSNYHNECFCLDYKNLFTKIKDENIACFYLDSPYTNDQYSRFYHVLETVCRYDYPELSYKALYRNDRIQSNFCYKNKVVDEFDYIISYVSKKKASLVISYTKKGVLNLEKLCEICKKYYNVVELKEQEYVYSSQGSGKRQTSEILLVMKASDINGNSLRNT